MRIVESYQPAPVEPSSQELISVVVAVYNIEAYVERCVRSLMAQTYGRLEILWWTTVPRTKRLQSRTNTLKNIRIS